MTWFGCFCVMKWLASLAGRTRAAPESEYATWFATRLAGAMLSLIKIDFPANITANVEQVRGQASNDCSSEGRGAGGESKGTRTECHVGMAKE